jgi:hypothetical protein
MIDLTLIPDEALKNEYMRRLNARRARGGGRPATMKPCPNCGKEFPATTLRLIHLPQCRKAVDARAIREAMNRNLFKGGPGVYAADAKGQWVRINNVKERKGLVYGRDVNKSKWFTVDRWEVR